MAMQNQLYGIDGTTVSFLQSKYIASKQHCKVSGQRKSDLGWEVINVNNYDVVTQSIRMATPLLPSEYVQMEIRVADTQDELGDSVTDIGIVAGIANEVTIVAGLETEIEAITSEPLNSAILGAEAEAMKAQAEAMTAESYATQPYSEYVKEYHYDGTSIVYTLTGKYSALHYSVKTEAYGISMDVREYVATAGQTDFGILHKGNSITVALNGFTLTNLDDSCSPEDYEVFGDKIVLTVPAELNDSIRVVGFGINGAHCGEAGTYPSGTTYPSSVLYPTT